MRTPKLTPDELEMILVPLLTASPRTMGELVEILNVSKRTAHRYLRQLQARGHTITRRGLSRPTRYQIDVSDAATEPSTV